MTKRVNASTCVNTLFGGASMTTKPSPLKAIVLDVRAGLAALEAAHDDQQRRYIAGLLCREATTLAAECLKRNAWLNNAYDWIEAHKDALEPDDLKAREERWLLSLRQYESAMHLLSEVLEIVKTTPNPVAATSRPSIPMAPPTQEAFL